MYVNENIKTIRFPVKTDEKLQAIANKCGLTKLKLFVYMVDYFYKTKKDPRDLNDELLKNAINKKTDNIVAFIRTQEQDLLIPVKKETERNTRMLGDIVNFFQKHIIGHNRQQQETYNFQSVKIGQIADLLLRMEKAQVDKVKLKSKFSQILEHYINQREQLSMLSKQSDKEELMRFVREQVQNILDT